eukprot:SAG31_NODE_9101_length_1332_cov_1.140891_2_plen_49_part_00
MSLPYKAQNIGGGGKKEALAELIRTTAVETDDPRKQMERGVRKSRQDG